MNDKFELAMINFKMLEALADQINERLQNAKESLADSSFQGAYGAVCGIDVEAENIVHIAKTMQLIVESK